MEILDTSERKHTVTLPPTCVDPTEYKPGDNISYKISGKVKSSDADYGVVVELSEGDKEDDLEQFENDDPETQEKKIKKQMQGKNKLEEYQ